MSSNLTKSLFQGNNNYLKVYFVIRFLPIGPEHMIIGCKGSTQCCAAGTLTLSFYNKTDQLVPHSLIQLCVDLILCQWITKTVMLIQPNSQNNFACHCSYTDVTGCLRGVSAKNLNKSFQFKVTKYIQCTVVKKNKAAMKN